MREKRVRDQTRLRLSAGSHRVWAVRTHRGVGGLLLLLVGDGRVHVDQTQEVQTQRRRQAAEQPAGSKVTVVTCSSCGAVGTSAPHRAAGSSDSYKQPSLKYQNDPVLIY